MNELSPAGGNTPPFDGVPIPAILLLGARPVATGLATLRVACSKGLFEPKTGSNLGSIQPNEENLRLACMSVELPLRNWTTCFDFGGRPDHFHFDYDKPYQIPKPHIYPKE